MKTSSRWLLTLLAAVALFAALAAFKFFQIQAAIAFGKSFPEASASVHAVVVEPSKITRYVTTIGEVVAPESIELRNELEGRIALVNVNSGQRLSKGDILLQLDISEETARLRAARARLELADLELRRLDKLYRQKTVSEDQLDKSRADFDIAKADIEALQAIIDKKTLTAPFDAIAGLHNWEAGEFLQANTYIATLVGINDYTWVDFNLPLPEATLNINSEVKLSLSLHGEGSRTAVVVARDAAASPASRNLRYRARLEGQPLPLPNAVVKVAVPTGEARVINIPSMAILNDSMGTYVYVLIPDKAATATDKRYRAQRRNVTITQQTEKFASVVAGLQAGDLVASDGAFKLHSNILTFVVSSEVAVKTEDQAAANNTQTAVATSQPVEN